MAESLVLLGTILLADIANPVLAAAMVFAAGCSRPVLKSAMLLLGHTFAYVSAGVVLLFTADAIGAYLANPSTFDFMVQLGIALLLLWMAWKSWQTEEVAPEQEQQELTVVGALGTGAVVNFVGLPFAVPYFAAIGEINQETSATLPALVLLLVYNLAYALPFASVPLLRAVMGEAADPLLDRMKGFMIGLGDLIMPLLLFGVGIVLFTDAVWYFTTGQLLL